MIMQSAPRYSEALVCATMSNFFHSLFCVRSDFLKEQI